MRRVRFGLLAAAIVVSAIAVVAVPARAQARTPARIIVSARSSTAKVYRRLKLRARLTTRRGYSLSKRTVWLESRPATGAVWSVVSTTTTSARGRASWKVHPQHDTYYRVRFAGSSSYTPATSPKKKIVGYHYAIRFWEPFDRSTVSTSTWTLRTRWGETKGLLQLCSDDSLETTAGHLIITATHATTTVDPKRPYVSGVISSHGAGQYHFKYGYVVTRAKIPRGMGLWPAVWMLGLDPKATSEIDILEARGQLPYTNLMTVHFNHEQHGKNYKGDDLTTAYHTFAIDWTANHIIWYRDGVERFRVTDKKQVSHDVMYLIANMQVGGWGGTPTAHTRFPARFYVDYIRVYKHQ